jgi:nucleotide-binding universal stress UspA family protein
MSEVIAALDNSLAAKPVLSTALALADLLDAEVTPVHVAVDGARVARNTAERAGLTLRTLRGPVVEQLLDQAKPDHVTALVLGARATPGDRRPLGSTAIAIATTLRKPVVIVPPDTRTTGALHRVLIPIESGLSASLTPRAIVALTQGTELEVVVLHVHEPASLPAFTDQPQHEHSAWAREFLHRYCPWGIGAVRLEVRIGSADELVPLVAEQESVDIIALGWAQELAEGRAAIVRAALTRAKVPVMLVPVGALTADVAPIKREESWSNSPSLRV